MDSIWLQILKVFQSLSRMRQENCAWWCWTNLNFDKYWTDHYSANFRSANPMPPNIRTIPTPTISCCVSLSVSTHRFKLFDPGWGLKAYLILSLAYCACYFNDSPTLTAAYFVSSTFYSKRRAPSSIFLSISSINDNLIKYRCLCLWIGGNIWEFANL